MNLLGGRFYTVLEVLTNFFLLNLIWLIMCIPVITIFPATTAMFGVIRQWINKEDYSVVFSDFFRFFKENFKTSFFIGCLWFIVAFLLYFDFYLMQQLGSTTKFLLFPIFLLLGILLTFTSVFLFPVLVHYNTSSIGALKTSFFLSISYLPATLLAVIVVAGLIGVFLMFPGAFFILFSVGSYIIYLICNRVFKKVESLKNANENDA
jgi:uncharacterized membrane protein YesL